MKTSRIIPMVGAAMLALAACGDGGAGASSSPSTDAAATTEGASAPEEGLTEVTVGALAVGDTAAVWLGQAEGFFEDEGLDVTIETTEGGAAAMAGLVSGSYDFAFANTISMMAAVDQGLDVRYVTNGTSTSGSEGGFGAVVVPEDSDIQTAADLAGRVVAVHNFANITLITVSYAAEQAGIDPDEIEYVEIALPESNAALANGNVEAAMLVEPFLTQALDHGNRVVSWAFQAIPDLDIAGYMTTNERIEQDPELVEAFTAAMNRSLEYAEENPDAVRAIVGTYTEIPEEAIAEMALPTFRTEFNVEGLETLGAAAHRYGVLASEPDITAILPAE